MKHFQARETLHEKSKGARPLADAMGITHEETLAIRRHAMRLEARGQWGLALDAYRMSTLVDPTQSANWYGLARCYRALGDEFNAHNIEVCARIIKEKMS